ncbi:type II secretion system protein GspM [Thioalkalivibrio sp. ALE11]|uniref:type II secretion system protein GspM n=1 Tax=Thioalkalivibrio sp. ALE11 TaxID=1265494 RepID=UPI0003779403|nr:type II secretion system protein GspM [Thioalkalivibrio sp. ALE11]
MKVEQWNQRERRFVAVGLLLALVMIVVFALVGPYLARYPHYLDAIATAEHQRERLERSAAQLPRLRTEVEALREQHEALGHVLEAETPALAAAEVQQLLSDVVTGHGGELQSTQVRPVREEEGFRRVTVSVRLSVDSEQLAGILSELEYRTPLMFVDDLNLRLESRRVRRGMESEESGRVNAQFDLHAYMGAGAP